MSNSAESAGASEETTAEETVNENAASTASKKGASRVAEKPKREIPVGEIVRKTRSIAARVIWIICVIAALSLAIGALLIVLKTNMDNGLVSFVTGLADHADLGVFDRFHGIKTFHGPDHVTKNVLVNWGIGALVWLVVGRIIERIIRP